MSAGKACDCRAATGRSRFELDEADTREILQEAVQVPMQSTLGSRDEPALQSLHYLRARCSPVDFLQDQETGRVGGENAHYGWVKDDRPFQLSAVPDPGPQRRLQTGTSFHLASWHRGSAPVNFPVRL